MTTGDATNPHTAQEAALCEHCHAIKALRLAIEGLEDENDRLGLMFLHNQLRRTHEEIFRLHDLLESADAKKTQKAA